MNQKRYLQIGVGLIMQKTRSSLAHATNFWAGLLSTLAFCISMILFIFMLTARVGTIAGYGRDHLILLILIGQLSFLTIANTMYDPLLKLNDNVRKGELDYTLLRPFPSLWYVFVSNIDFVFAIITIVPYICITVPLISWEVLNISLSNILPAFLVWLSGLGIVRFLCMLLVVPVFFVGDSEAMFDMMWSMLSQYLFPYQVLPSYIKVLSFSILPFLLTVPGTAYVLVSRHTPYLFVVTACLVGLTSQFFMIYVWRWALRRYTSASS